MGGHAAISEPIGMLFRLGAIGTLGDAELLGRFVSERGEGSERAFEALVERHGPMVLAVCRRILRDPDAAQDAFQATFLVFARKAGRIGRRERLGGWLHGVASRTAMKARATAARRRRHERSRAESTVESTSPAEDVSEIRAALHEEIARLPEKYRTPIVLCHLEGMTRERASAALCCPEGTVGVRLMRARERLRAGLTRRGFAVAAGALAVDLGAESASAALAPGMAESTARAASAFAAGRPVAGMVSPHALNLTRGVLRSMRVTQVMILAPALLLTGALGYTAIAARQKPAEPAQKPAEPVSLPQVIDGPVWGMILPHGEKVEVIGVSPDQREMKTWWAPDGSPLAEPAFERLGVELGKQEGQKPRAFAVKVSGPADPTGVGVTWEFHDAHGNGSSTPAWDRTPPRQGVFGAVASLPADAKVAAFRVGVAAGPWVTIGTTTFGQGIKGFGGDGAGLAFTKARALKQGGVALTVVDGYLPANVRIVAIDVDGKEHGTRESTSTVQNGPVDFRIHDVTFDLPPERIDEIRFQTRPYEWAEFRGVAIEPAARP